MGCRPASAICDRGSKIGTPNGTTDLVSCLESCGTWASEADDLFGPANEGVAPSVPVGVPARALQVAPFNLLALCPVRPWHTRLRGGRCQHGSPGSGSHLGVKGRHHSVDADVARYKSGDPCPTSTHGCSLSRSHRCRWPALTSEPTKRPTRVDAVAAGRLSGWGAVPHDGRLYNVRANSLGFEVAQASRGRGDGRSTDPDYSASRAVAGPPIETGSAKQTKPLDRPLTVMRYREKR